MLRIGNACWKLQELFNFPRQECSPSSCKQYSQPLSQTMISQNSNFPKFPQKVGGLFLLIRQGFSGKFVKLVTSYTHQKFPNFPTKYRHTKFPTSLHSPLRPITANSKPKFPTKTSYRNFYRIASKIIAKTFSVKTAKIRGKSQNSCPLRPIKISLKSPKQNLRQNPKNRH